MKTIKIIASMLVATLCVCLIGCNPIDNPVNNPTKEVIGEFSVSGNKKVMFSKGNLQYRALTNEWRFAPHQYEYIGNSQYGNSYSGWMDNFYWGSGENPTINPQKWTKDWGSNVIGGVTKNIYYTPVGGINSEHI